MNYVNHQPSEEEEPTSKDFETVDVPSSFSIDILVSPCPEIRKRNKNQADAVGLELLHTCSTFLAHIVTFKV